MLSKVISGGQNGVDQAALRAAKKSGLATGGYMPSNYLTLDGPRPDLAIEYGMVALSSPKYPPRTKRNVADSDGTLQIAKRLDSPGERLTAKCVAELGKPRFVVDLNKPVDIAAIKEWLIAQRIKTLNVAGNSLKSCPGIDKIAEEILLAVFKTQS